MVRNAVPLRLFADKARALNIVRTTKSIPCEWVLRGERDERVFDSV
jgi:hypothetical protein